MVRLAAQQSANERSQITRNYDQSDERSIPRAVPPSLNSDLEIKCTR
jgi:hypothetical protein